MRLTQLVRESVCDYFRPLSRRWFWAFAAVLVGAAFALAQPPAFFLVSPAAPAYDPGIPDGAEAYDSAKYTQSIFVLNDADTIRPIPIADLPDRRWHQPGGMQGVKGWRSERFRYLPAGTTVKAWVGNIEVDNSIKTGRLKPDGTPETFKQHNRGLLRSYPDGTRFDEVLRNATTGAVFEHRVREKKDGKWVSTVYHKDESEYPAGYTGLTVSCSSCHSETATGKYDAGLVPGGDTVFSDPLEWTVWTANPPEVRKGPVARLVDRFKVEPAPKMPPPAAPKPEPKKEPPKAAPPKAAPVPVAPPAVMLPSCPNGNCPAPVAPRRRLLFRW